MNPEHPTHSSKKRLLLIIGVSIVLVGISFGLTVALLRAATPHKETASNSSSTPSGSIASIDQILAAYPSSIASLKKYQQLPNSAQASIQYKQSDKTYSISLLTNKTVTFVAQTTNSSPTSLPDEINAFFTSKGFTAQQNSDATAQNLTYATFTNSESACQVGMTKPSQSTVQAITLGCISLADISKEYGFVDQLLSLYTKNNPKPTFTTESRNLVTSDNKSLSIVRLNSSPNQLALLFAAIDDQWEYITTLSDGDSASSNGKFTPNSDVTSALDNPKYGDFLKNNIQ